MPSKINDCEAPVSLNMAIGFLLSASKNETQPWEMKGVYSSGTILLPALLSFDLSNCDTRRSDLDFSFFF